MSRSRANASQQEEAEGSLEGNALIESAWRAFQAAQRGLLATSILDGEVVSQGEPFPDWSELDDSFLLPFSAAVLQIRDYILGSEELPEGRIASFSAAAGIGLAALRGGLGFEAEQDSSTAQIAFEAVARHITNALAWDAEDHGELEGHETGWADWATQKKSQLQGVS
jgi:hypothetical protein